MPTRTRYDASSITPSSLVGDEISLHSRNIILPFNKIQIEDENNCDDDEIFYSGICKDNSKAKITKETINRDCLNKEDTIYKLGSSLRGTQFFIITKSKIKSYKKVNLTARHKAQNFDFKDFTFVVLEKEETSIIKSSEYQLLSKLKNELIQKKVLLGKNGDIEEAENLLSGFIDIG